MYTQIRSTRYVTSGTKLIFYVTEGVCANDILTIKNGKKNIFINLTIQCQLQCDAEKN